MLRRLVARFAVDELVAATNKERIAETKEADRGSDLPHVSWIKLTQLSGRGSKLFERNVGKLQAREHVVAPPLRRGCQSHPFLALPAVAALPSQLVAESCAGRNWIHAVAHWVLLFASFKKRQINTMEVNVVDSSRAQPPACRDGHVLAQISPGVAAPGFDVNKSPPWPPLLQTGDGLGRDIQRKPDVLLG